MIPYVICYKTANNVAEYLLKYPETTGRNGFFVMPVIFPTLILTITAHYELCGRIIIWLAGFENCSSEEYQDIKWLHPNSKLLDLFCVFYMVNFDFYQESVLLDLNYFTFSDLLDSLWVDSYASKYKLHEHYFVLLLLLMVNMTKFYCIHAQICIMILIYYWRLSYSLREWS